MAVYQVVKIGDPVLREVAKEVPKVTPNIHKLLDDMFDTMYAEQGVGLAAPQIGISKRVVVIDVGEGRVELINPVFLEKSEEIVEDVEGCLSIPGHNGKVRRHARVVVKALNRDGEEIVVEGTGLFSVALQHEIDHLDGVLFVDREIKK